MYLSVKDLMDRYKVSKPTIWRWQRERADFPKPYSLSPGCSRWLLSDIEAWEAVQEKVV